MCDLSGVPNACSRWSLTTPHSDWSGFKMSPCPLWPLESAIVLYQSLWNVPWCLCNLLLIEDSSGPLRRFVGLSFCITHFIPESAARRPAVSAFPSSDLLLNPHVLPGSVWFSSGFSIVWKLPPGDQRNHLGCFSSLKDQSPVLRENSHVICFISFFRCKRLSLVSITLSWLEARNLFWVFKYFLGHDILNFLDQ